jgi:polyisoprenoid-binding protein YceI
MATGLADHPFGSVTPAVIAPKEQRPIVIAMSKLKILGALVFVLVVAVGAGGLFYVFGRSTPPAVSLGASSTPAATSSTGTSASSSPESTAALEGTWTVDTSIGSFSDFSDSYVGYRVQEELVNIGGSTAVGRTPNVTGSFTIAGTSITAASFQADLSTLQSDNSMRDGQLQRQGIETDTYPTASFKLTQPIDLGTLPAEGQTITVNATGELTLHGVTKTVVIPLQAKLSGGVVTIIGSTEITLADYNIVRPQSMMVLSVADHGTLELQLLFTHS